MESSHEVIRAFLAVEVPDSAKVWIEKKRRELKRECKGSVRWVHKEAFHITLHFFGNIPPQVIGKVEAIANSLTPRYSPFHLRLKGVGAFPNLRFPRILWVGIEDLTKEKNFRNFQRTLRSLLEQAGFSVEKRPFTPHITIGRVKRSGQCNVIPPHNSPEGPSFSVPNLTFFKSDLTPNGPIYTPLNRFAFKGEKE